MKTGRNESQTFQVANDDLSARRCRNNSGARLDPELVGRRDFDLRADHGLRRVSRVVVFYYLVRQEQTTRVG